MKVPKTQRVGPFQLRLPKTSPMLVEAEVFASDRIPVEAVALGQLADAASLPGVAQVLATPDIHVGYGVPIGAVVAAKDFISPAAVGYDINCGMRLIKTPWRHDELDLSDLAEAVRRVIPLGEGRSNLHLNDRALGKVLERGVPGLLWAFEHQARLRRDHPALVELDLDEERASLPHIERSGSLEGAPGAVPERAWQRGAPQLGTLGGGNHFIEFQRVDRLLDPSTAEAWGIQADQLVIMIHSGSRGLGHEVGGTFMKLATRYDKKHGIRVPNPHLSILPLASEAGRDFLGAMNSAANYAFANRHAMAMLVKGVLRKQLGSAELPTLYDVAHNLASLERHGKQRLVIHRKGATRAFPPERMAGTPFAEVGQPVLIPGSMGTASYLLRGVESGAKSLFSTNHGAGRVLSRTAARGGRGRGKSKKRVRAAISDAAFEESMRDILLLCQRPGLIKEEAPGAYKDIDAVIDTVIGAELAAPVARLLPLAVLKG
jgi:tRNA-splicing ligase RtcB